MVRTNFFDIKKGVDLAYYLISRKFAKRSAQTFGFKVSK